MYMLRQKITCPFCFASFSAREILFRCSNEICPGRVEDTIFAGARRSGATVMGRVLTPNKRSFSVGVPRTAQCDVCKKESRTRLCPSCHFELSHDVGQIDQRIIAIIGGSNAGKSHYIAALITRLQHEVGANFDFAFSMVGDDTRKRWMIDFYRPLFENRRVLDPTLSAVTDLRVKTPLLFRLTFQHGNHTQALNISFFDTAGEDMANLKVDSLSMEARYICHADGIIVLLDPLQIESIRQQVPRANVPISDPMARPQFIVERLRELYEQYYRIPATRKIKIPIAFTFSKVDTLLPIMAPDSALFRPGEHFGTLDMLDVQNVSTEIGNYMQTWINPGFCKYIDVKFANYRYFGISSLGRQPDTNNRLAKAPDPLRVEDPFLWILQQFDLVKAKKGQ